MDAKSRSSAWIQAGFDAVERGMNGARGGAVHQLKTVALRDFLAQGIPSSADEEWHYTDISELASRQYELPVSSTQIDRGMLEKHVRSDGTRAVLVDGCYNQSLSQGISPGLSLQSLGDFFHGSQTNPLISQHFNTVPSLHSRGLSGLNTSLAQDGVVVFVEAGASVDIEILYLSTVQQKAVIYAPRTLIVLGNGARARVIERFVALGSSERFSCAVSEILLGENSHLDYYVVSDQGDSTIAYHSVQAQVERGAQFRSHLFPLGGRLARNEVNVNLIGSGSHATINGLSAPIGNQHVDNSTVVRHAVPHCESSQLFKGIYSNKSRGVFQGTIIVEKDAQKTNAFQSNQAVLLSKEASVDTKPQLKIWADDVKCTHGATVGQLDDEALFYIKSRGISQEVAAALLIEAFAGEVIKGIAIESLRAEIRGKLFEKLGLEAS